MNVESSFSLLVLRSVSAYEVMKQLKYDRDNESVIGTLTTLHIRVYVLCTYVILVSVSCVRVYPYGYDS